MIRVGQRLYEERTIRGLSIEEVAKATKIRPQFIKAIETGNYRQLPSSAYAAGFVKNYILFLGLSPKQLLPVFRREFDEKEHFGVLPESFTEGKKIRVRRLHLRRMLGITFFILIPLLTYILFQYRFAFLNPALSLQSPVENAVITTDTVIIKGKAENNVLVTVNDSSVLVDTTGSFKKELPVFSGEMTITIKAINSFGRQTVMKRHILVK